MEKLSKLTWWKWLTMGLLVYVVIGAFLFEVPRLHILNEGIRNLHFHVPMWFGMIFLFLASVVSALRYLRSNDLKYDTYSSELAGVGLLFGIIGITTGMVWARFTWGEFWSSDPQQNASAIGLLLYFALFILRGSVQDDQQKARLSAVYNIFAFSILIPLLFILPRLTSSLHPGSGGNPGFNAYDLDSNLRLVFYPAVIGWTLLGFWIASIKIRFANLTLHEQD